MASETPYIRPYLPHDEQDMIHIFRETAAPDLRAAGDKVLTYGSYIWCRPYLMLAPEHCFVLDDGTGKAVGYIIGTHDTAEFVRQVREVFVPYLLVEGLHPPDPGEEVGWNENLPNALRFIMHSPENLLHLEEPELLRDFPAHLHIDILPGHQRLGFGRKLIDMFTTALKDQGVKGVHLIMSEANVEAAKFYLHTGWKRFPKVLDGGKSGEEGVKEYAAWMVKSL